MKNFYIQTIVLLFVVLAGFTSKTNAQFASSTEVYCYQYVKTDNNGVVSKNPHSDYRADYSNYFDMEVYFVNFQNGIMGIYGASTAMEAGQKIISDPTYYNNKVIEKLARDWEIWNKTYSSAPFGASKSIIKYSSSYSTSSKYTYGVIWKYLDSRSQGDFASWAWMYTFTIDKSEMILWSLDQPNKRHYYKKIDPNSLKPNLDFLD